MNGIHVQPESPNGLSFRNGVTSDVIKVRLYRRSASIKMWSSIQGLVSSEEEEKYIVEKAK